MLLVKPGCQANKSFKGTCYFLTKSEGGKGKARPVQVYPDALHVETWVLPFRLDLQRGDMIIPGDQA